MRSIVVCLGMLLGCTSADVLRVDRTPRPVLADRAVPLLLDEPTRPYLSIALVEVSGTWGASLERMGRRLVIEAIKLGGDAVLLTRRSSHSNATLLPVGDSFLAIDSDDSRLVGKVIVYLEPADSTTPSPQTSAHLP